MKIEKIIMEKKEYISPVAEIVEIGTLSMLALSKESGEQMDDEDQMSKEYRGDWDRKAAFHICQAIDCELTHTSVCSSAKWG